MMMWLPTLKEVLNDSPVPMSPSKSEVHAREAPVREPSSGSVPVPVKSMLTPVSKDSPGAGLVMLAEGGALGAATVMLTDSAATTPWLSVAVSVMVWLPAFKEALKEPPVPSCPSSPVEVHARESAIRGPSSGSSADPLNTMLSEVRKVSPLAGLTMLAVGGPLGGSSTMMPTVVLTVAPSPSVASKTYHVVASG